MLLSIVFSFCGKLHYVSQVKVLFTPRFGTSDAPMKKWKSVEYFPVL